jgi:DHA1 family tetracycline resistance protein-like MFS transporter
LLSRITPISEQGAIFGALSSAQTLARMVNYLVANVLLARFGPAAPFWEAGGIAVVALGLALVVVQPLIGTRLETAVGGDSRSAEVAAPRR